MLVFRLVSKKPNQEVQPNQSRFNTPKVGFIGMLVAGDAGEHEEEPTRSPVIFMERPQMKKPSFSPTPGAPG